MVDGPAHAAIPTWVRCASAVVRRLPAGRYRLMNWLCQRPPPVFVATMDRRDGGPQFHCDLRDSISREVCFTGRYEPQETALLKALLRPGDTFVDVGANWGYFTLLAAHRVGDAGRVVSLEPDPRLFRVLRQNISRNRLRCVTALQIAAADVKGQMSLAGFEESGGNFGLSRLLATGVETEGACQVSTNSLDDLLDEMGIRRVAVIKMDIEGAEAMAISGLTRALSERRVERLLLELHPSELKRHHSSAGAVIDQMIRTGYRPWKVDHARRATRRAAYGKDPRPESFLRPLNGDKILGEWPHVLWVAPGMEVLA